MLQNFEKALEYMNQSMFSVLRLKFTSKPYTKKKYNKFCKAISKTDKNCELYDFKFNDILQFNKLLNSMCSLKEINFLSWIFTFTGDLRIKESAKYEWKLIRIEDCTFTAKTYISIIRVLGKLAKLALFKFKQSVLYLKTDDETYLSIIKALKLRYSTYDNKTIIIQDISWNSSYFEEAVEKLEHL